MRQLHVGVLDIVETPTSGIFPRVMNGNFASIMPQVVGAWCELRQDFRMFRADRIVAATECGRYPERRAVLLQRLHQSLARS